MVENLPNVFIHLDKMSIKWTCSSYIRLIYTWISLSLVRKHACAGPLKSIFCTSFWCTYKLLDEWQIVQFMIWRLIWVQTAKIYFFHILSIKTVSFLKRKINAASGRMKTSNAYNADQPVRQRCLIKAMSFSQGTVLKNVMTPKTYAWKG